MLLVYTHKVTPRVKYIFKQICTRILGISVSFTSTIEEFIAHDDLKMSYAKQPLGKELFVRSHDLLHEQGLAFLTINVNDWGNTKCFFTTGDKSHLPYDIFAASFYLLTRYEEYLPHVQDDYGRFVAEESIAYKNGFLYQPVVDVWAYKFLTVLRSFYPDFNPSIRRYQINPIIDVPMAYDFKQKGIMRTFGGTMFDLGRFRFRRLYQRYSVLFGFKKDPYDTFSYIINRQKTSESKFNVFFLIGNYSTYDKNININKKVFVSLIKSVADYCKVGLKVSYFALENLEILKKEKRTMEEVINTPLNSSRHSFSKLNLPDSYRNLVELEINEDYTMGYIDQLGFRAGTCTPFFFYDLDYETKTPLLINTFHVIDSALLKYNSLLDKKKTLNEVIVQVKKVNGTFSPVFHNYTFSDEPKWEGFKELFNIILDSHNEA
ncbi:MAG: hypothetical protein HKO72_09245 [Flavobacteriaceae bacterium]|nr:polysaccharide deacetylase family protein [Bacteroidia bacterium]NNL61504.1 hypothetical protein [Flavobacteriaceae bacterium]